jgi:hypothetical protein
MAILKRDDILLAADIKKELLPVPEWGGEVFVKALSGTERDRWETSMIQMKGTDRTINMQNIRAKLASMAICDEDGKRLFSDNDVLALGQKSASALQRVFELAQKLSGIGDDAVEELTEGVKTDPFDDSLTG